MATLTDQQRRIIEDARDAKVVRITAGAGTGKTTTLLQIAQELAGKHRRTITYVTFNKAAATDGKRRLEMALEKDAARLVDARTLHSCAMSLLADHREEQYSEVEVESKVLGDNELKNEINKHADEEITDFLRDAFVEIERIFWKLGPKRIRDRKDAARKQVVFFIFKTLTQFCRRAASREDLAYRGVNWAKRNLVDYYPAKKFHEMDGKGPSSFGFRCQAYRHKTGFYAVTSHMLWEKLGHIRTFDFEMKRAQLLKLTIPSQVILVDECQDLDACQIDFIARQESKQIFFVGDAAQSIYSFRGAKSENLLGITGGVDYRLTTSFRFGPAIANLANVVLYAKENSPQTKARKKTWVPYRLIGSSKDAIGNWVADVPFSETRCNFPFTIIGFRNSTLLVEAVKLICSVNSSETDGMASMPKFHLNGKAERGTVKKWKDILSETRELFRLKHGKQGERVKLSDKFFPDFPDPTTWNEFLATVERLELNKYAPSIGIVAEFRERTLEMLDLFQREVMDKPCSKEDADVILSTCHAAKGMEWDRVQVADDFVSLQNVCQDGVSRKRAKIGCESFSLCSCRSKYHFNFKSWGDDVNLLYVACTRAKKTLSLPKSLRDFLTECDELHRAFRPLPTAGAELIDCDDENGKQETVLGSPHREHAAIPIAPTSALVTPERGLSSQEIRSGSVSRSLFTRRNQVEVAYLGVKDESCFAAVYEDIVQPLRQELGCDGQCISILDAINGSKDTSKAETQMGASVGGFPSTQALKDSPTMAKVADGPVG